MNPNFLVFFLSLFCSFSGFNYWRTYLSLLDRDSALPSPPPSARLRKSLRLLIVQGSCGVDSNDDSHHSLSPPFWLYSPEVRRDRRACFFFFRTGFPTGRPVQVGSKGPGCFVSPHVADVVSARQIACAAQKLGCGMWIFDFMPLRYRVADGVYR